jgi:hypothetical protein
MFARLDRKEIDRHFTYALTIVQANVHVRDLIEKAFSEQLRAMESLCVAQALPHIPPPPIRSWNFATKA